MKNQAYVDRLPIGEVVSSRQVLAAMKKRGLIEDYSWFGYLEYEDAYNPLPKGDFEYMGSWFTTQYLDGCFKAYLVKRKPPYQWDAKTQTRRYSRMAARSYRYQFKHDSVHDQLQSSASEMFWRLLRKYYHSLPESVYKYRARKLAAIAPVHYRYRDEKYVHRSMSMGMFGAGVL